MTATPMLDRLAAEARKALGEHAHDLVAPEVDEGDEAPAMAWRAAEAAVPALPPTQGPKLRAAVYGIAEACEEVMAIGADPGEPEIRRIMTDGAWDAYGLDLERCQAAVDMADADDADLAQRVARFREYLETARQIVVYFLVNDPGGLLNDAFDLVVGLGEDDEPDEQGRR